MDLYSKGQVQGPMKQYLVPGMISALREQMDTLLVDEEKLKGCQDAGWLGEGRQALDPAWFYHVWDPQQKCEVRSHTEIMKDLDALTKVLQLDHVLLQFKCTKPLTEKADGAAVPFLCSISLRTPEARRKGAA